MQYSEDTIIKDVRVAFDENTSIAAFADTSGTLDPDTLEMEEIIRSKISDAINAVRASAPLPLLTLTCLQSGANWPIRWTDEEKGIGEVELPDDCLRLAMFKMSDWAHGVANGISPGSALYGQQFSRWKGVRGNPSRPQVAIASNPSTGGKVIQFFSCDTTDATASLAYIKRITGRPESGSYEIEEAIYRAVVLKTASLVALAYGNADMAGILSTMAGELANAQQQ